MAGISSIVISLLVFISVLLGLMGYRLFRLQQQYLKLNKHNDALKLLLKQLERQQESSRQEIKELHLGAQGVLTQYKGLQQAIEKLNAKQDEIVAQKDPASRLYSRAAKMVELGADLEEIMRECDLPAAEARLLVHLHRQSNN